MFLNMLISASLYTPDNLKLAGLGIYSIITAFLLEAEHCFMD